MKKHFFLSFLIFLFLQNIVQGQDVSLGTQADVDAFDTSITTINGNFTIFGNNINDLSNLSNITSIDGFLLIRLSSSIQNLDGLINITNVGGDLKISDNNGLQNLDGLSNITTVGGDLLVLDNPNLENLDGLSSVTTVGNGVSIEENDAIQNLDGLSNITNNVVSFLMIGSNTALQNLEGLTNITAVEEELSIFANSSLQNLDGLTNLTSVGGSLHIADNPVLQNLVGLANITVVGEDLTISDNDALENLDGLAEITTAGGHLLITRNVVLQNLDGLANITAIESYLTISNNDALENLDGLSNLTSIGGDLWIFDNTSLKNLEGLANITAVVGGLRISGNDILENLDGLTNINAVEGNLRISENDSLQNINALVSITVVEGDLWISNNDVLENLAGLENITTIGGSLTITGNDALQNINALANVTAIEDFLRISDNDVLENLDGLVGLTDIEDLLRISDNNLLQNINGLANITSIETVLFIKQNASLQNLDGLAKLTVVGLVVNISNNNSLQNLDGLASLNYVDGDFNIFDNNNLTNCCGILELLLDPNSIDGNINIYNNPFECSSQEVITLFCESSPSAKGCMYWDENQNGTKDIAEKGLPAISSVIYPDDIIRFTDAAGCFTHPLDNGDYNLTYGPSPLWQLSSDSAAYHITINNDYHTGLDFGFIPTNNIIEGNIHVAGGIPRCFREVEFDFNFRNEGTTILSGILWGQVWDEWMEVDSYIQPPDTIDQTADGVRWGWFYEDLYPGALLQRKIVLQMPAINEEGFEFGDSYLVSSTVEANAHTGGTEYYDYNLQEEIVCAYDPNDKLVSPDREGDENFTLFDEDLVYTIRFQNTGNDTAFTVVVQDTLNHNLNASSFRVLASSHQNILRTEIVESQYVTFTFDDILLPDSTTNFNGSQGYVTYTIQPNEGLNENTVIENTASIYFDFNPPIVTNTTQNTMLSCLPIEEVMVEATINAGEFYTLPNGDVVQEPGNYTVELLDEEGCPTEIIITILDVLTSSSNLAWDELVTLSPNPADGHFILNIQTPDLIDHELILTNTHGQVVFTNRVHESQTKFDVEHLAPGIYWVQLRSQTDELVAIQKLMVVR